MNDIKVGDRVKWTAPGTTICLGTVTDHTKDGQWRVVPDARGRMLVEWDYNATRRWCTQLEVVTT